MDISSIDKNFEFKVIQKDAFQFYSPLEAPFQLEGFPWYPQNGEFLRLPKDALHYFNPDIAGLLAYHTAGGAVRFRTDSPCIAICAKLRCTLFHINMSYKASRGMDLYQNGSFIGNFCPMEKDSDQIEGSMTLPRTEKGMQDYLLYFPTYSGVESLVIGLSNGAHVEAPRPHSIKKPIIFYGSSITQGACASQPGMGHCALVSRALDAELINLGFSGNAKAEPEMADLIGGLDASVFVMDYDHNAPDPDFLADTHRAFYERYRTHRPDTPVVFITRPPCNPFSAEDTQRRREIIQSTYQAAQQAGDRRTYLVDGAEFFPSEFQSEVSVDLCHPNDLGFYWMMQKILPAVRLALEENGEMSETLI